MKYVNNIPTTQFFTGISRNTLTKSYRLSLTECVWDSQDHTLWDTHKHALFYWYLYIPSLSVPPLLLPACCCCCCNSCCSLTASVCQLRASLCLVCIITTSCSLSDLYAVNCFSNADFSSSIAIKIQTIHYVIKHYVLKCYYKTTLIHYVKKSHNNFILNTLHTKIQCNTSLWVRWVNPRSHNVRLLSKASTHYQLVLRIWCRYLLTYLSSYSIVQPRLTVQKTVSKSNFESRHAWVLKAPKSV